MEHNNSAYDLIVLGGGASGIMAAIAAKKKNKHLNVLLLEKNKILGRKILATGNGRCNFSNLDQNIDNYRSSEPKIAAAILANFDLFQTLSFFMDLGLKTRKEDNRLYPRSNEGKVIVMLMEKALQELGVKIETEINIQNIIKSESGFELLSKESKTFFTHSMILASGGKAAPQLGSDGFFLPWLQKEGHSIIQPLPALTPLQLNLKGLKKISGVRFQGSAEIVLGKQQILAKSRGEFLWTNYGISGIPVLEISRYAAFALSKNKRVKIRLDFLDDLEYEVSQEEVRSWQGQKKEQIILNLSGYLNSRLAGFLADISFTPKKDGDFFTKKELLNLHSSLRAFEVEVTDTMSFKEAQSTAGGVSLKEIDTLTMESKRVKNLYLCGELLDVDGNCGGYNLQWAWSSGYLAGQGAVKSFNK